MNLEQIAQQFNVDPASLLSLIAFLKSNMQRQQESGEVDFANLSDAEKGSWIKAGVEAWRDASTKFFGELIENKSERAKQWRSDMAEQVYNDIRAKQAA